MLITTFRYLKHRSFYTILNVTGLGLSVTLALLTGFYIYDQYSYDRHVPDRERVFRVCMDLNMNGKRDIYANAPKSLTPFFRHDFPQVEEICRLVGLNGLEIHTASFAVEDRRVGSKQAFAAEGNVFRIFPREFVQGNPDHALTEPNSIVVSESFAKDLFGSADAFGKIIAFEDKSLKITGVVRDEVHNSHLPMEAIVSWITLTPPDDMSKPQWYGNHRYTYMKLAAGQSLNDFESRMPDFYLRYMKKQFDDFHGTGRIFFQPLSSLYMTDELVWEPYPHGSAAAVMAVALATLFVLLFATINYVNLATAQSTERLREVSIRKILGSSRSGHVTRFLSESIMLSLFSGSMALVLAVILLPTFNALANTQIPTADLVKPLVILFMIAGSVLIGMLAGAYPAFQISSLGLKGGLNKTFQPASGGGLRKTLVVVQYTIAAMLMAIILLVAEQIEFIRTKDIGYTKDGLIQLEIPSDSISQAHADAFKESISLDPHVVAVGSSIISLDKSANHFTPVLQNPDGTTFSSGANLLFIDPDFLQTIGAKLIAGRNFDKASKANEKFVLINEAALKKFGWSANPLGGRFAGWTPTEPEPLDIAGVVKDFNIGVSYQQVQPLIMFYTQGGNAVYVRLADGRAREGIRAVRKAWGEFYPGYPFEFQFTDRQLDSLYQKEERLLALLQVFSLVTVVIASLGIVGLISFTVDIRKKELAIRKVLGMTFRGTVALLSGQFGALLLTGNIIAAPLVYWIMQKWLEGFAYHIGIGVVPFLVTVGVSVLFTGVSLSFHTVRAAKTNPVEALRGE